VVSAHVAVIAVGRWPAHAAPVAARVAGGAGTAVVARGFVVGVHAADAGVAAVVGAHVPVVAVGWWPTVAEAAAARVVRRAGVVVAARSGVVGVDAARLRIAAVVGTDIAVVAVGGWSTNAVAVATHVAGGTGVAVVAGSRVVGVHTPGVWVAAVVGADIAVIA